MAPLFKIEHRVGPSYQKFNKKVAIQGAQSTANEIIKKYQKIGVPPDMWARLLPELQTLIPKPPFLTHCFPSTQPTNSKKMMDRERRAWRSALNTAISNLAWHEATAVRRLDPPAFSSGMTVESALFIVRKEASDWWVGRASHKENPLLVLQEAHDTFGKPEKAFGKRKLSEILVENIYLPKNVATQAATEFLELQKTARAQARQLAANKAALKRLEVEERKTLWRLSEIAQGMGVSNAVLRLRINKGLLPVAGYARTQFSSTQTTLHSPKDIRDFLAAHFPHIDPSFLDVGSARQKQYERVALAKTLLQELEETLEEKLKTQPNLYARLSRSFACSLGVAGLSVLLDRSRLPSVISFNPKATIGDLEREFTWWRDTLSSRLRDRLSNLNWSPHQCNAVRTKRVRSRVSNLSIQWPLPFQESASIEIIDQTISNLLGAYFRDNTKEFSYLSGVDPADPQTWFAPARKLSRKWVLHLGPTNSGKTHDAMQELFKARTGVYLAPLRLLALEAYDRLVSQELPACLVTGEEREESIPDASGLTHSTHFAATIEAGVGLNREWDIAIVDEAQLISDQNRGWAWAQALTGLCAREIHVCAAPAAEYVLVDLAAQLGETVEIRRHERLTPLSEIPSPITLKNIQAGDALIAFSRRQVLSYRSWLRSRGLSVAVLYGDLGPEVRRAESERFRSGEAQILVATDAIGMGLNLPIKRVIFAEGEKFDGKSRRPLRADEWRQIAGRAGRKGLYPEGWYGRLNGVESFSNRCTQMNTPRFRPTPEIVDLLASNLGWTNIREVVDFWSGYQSSKLVPPSEWDNMDLVNALSGSGLPLLTQYHYLHAPLGRQALMDTLVDWIENHAKDVDIPLPDAMPISIKVDTPSNLAHLEGIALRLRLYRWCALSFPQVYTHESQEVHEKIARTIMDSLQNNSLINRCDECGCELSVKHPHAKCDSCFMGARHGYSSYW